MMSMQSTWWRLIGTSLLVTGIWVLGAAAEPIEVGGEDSPEVRPYRELAYSPADILEARRRARLGANPDIVQKIFEQCDRWMAYSEKQIIDLIPPVDASFAYGMAGDPKTGQAWPRFGRSDDMCSVDRPGEVKSPFTGDIYGIQKPGEEYYDPGDGWVRPGDGKRFYFKGIWNAYIEQQLHAAIENLAIGYLLTGDPAVGRRALVILDQFATLRAKRPETDGTADWVTPLRPGMGYFSNMGNIANDRTVYIGLAFDLLANAPYGDEPSSLDPAVTVRDNILQHYFSVYEPWYITQKKGLQNHALMVLANMTVQGLLKGDADYLRTGIDGTYAFLDGTFNRDGDYYEIAGGYGHLGRSYSAVMTTLLSRYDPARYDNAAELPKPSDYPHSLKFGNDRRWYLYCSDLLFRLPILGRDPQYGDSKPDRYVLLDKTEHWLAWRRCTYLRMLMQTVTRPEWLEHMQQLYASIAEQDIKEPIIHDLMLQGLGMWPLPPAEIKNAEAAQVSKTTMGQTSDVMPGKGIIILRSGIGPDSRALFVRGGAGASHGHDDQMAIVPYGNGMVLVGEYGYNYAGTNDHIGWGSRAIAHLAATVNQDLPPSYFYKGRSADVTAPQSDIVGYLSVPPAQCFEMRNTGMWRDIAKDMKDYRRLSWLIDADAQHYYFLDVFQIVGGQTHDYTWNAPYDDHESVATFNVAGIDPQPQPGVWVLAALDGQNQDVTWNKPKQSWGERLNGAADGQVRDLKLGDIPTPDKIYLWNPPPGNGYGMIWDVKAQQTDSDWSATWKLVDDKHYLRTEVINYDGMTAVTARSPSLLIDKHHHLILERRTQPEGVTAPLRSRFVTVAQVGDGDDWPVRAAQKLAVTAEREADAVAVGVELADGKRDCMLASRTSQRMATDDVTVQGCRGFARFDADGKLAHLALQEGTLIEAGGWRIEAERDCFEAKVRQAKADWDESRLTIDRKLPVGDVLAGSMVLIDSPSGASQPYSHSDYYAIETVEQTRDGGSVLIFRGQSLIATRLRLGSVDAEKNVLTGEWPNELAGLPGTFDFVGRMIQSRQHPDHRTLVRSYVGSEVQVLRAAGFKIGDDLEIYVAKPNDRLTMPTTVTLTKQDDGSFLLRSNAAVTLTCQAAAGSQLMMQINGQASRQLGQADAKGVLQVKIDPAETGSAVMSLRWDRR